MTSEDLSPSDLAARAREIVGDAHLDAAALERLGELAAGAGDPDALMEAADILGGDGGLFLRGEAHALAAEEEEALSPWLTLCDRLDRQEAAAPVGLLAARILDLHDSPAAARHLLENCAHSGDWGPALERAEALLRSLPRDPRAALVSGRARKEAGERGAAELFARALEGAIREKRDDLAEEAFLLLVEETGKPEALARGMRNLVEAARRGRAAWASTLLEIGEEAFAEAELLPLFLECAADAARGGADLEPMRERIVSAMHEVHKGKAYLPKVLEITAIEEEGADLALAFQRVDEVLSFPPGRYVAHHTYGVGPVLDTDGESVEVTFSVAGRKTMTLTMARKALALLHRDDIRVQMAREADSIRTEVEEDPVAVLVRGLRHLGGEATGKQLREALTPDPVAERAWNTWWRKARDAALGDPRVSTSEAYRDLFRIPTGGEEEGLPALQEVRDRRRALDLLRRLLRDQPEREDEARRAFLPHLETWLAEDLDLRTRVRVLLQLDRWAPERSEARARLIGEMFDQGMTLSAATTAEDQERLLSLGLRSGAAEAAALAGLSSRYVTVRDAAVRGLVDRGDAALQTALRKVLAQGEPTSVRHVATWYAGGGQEGFGQDLSPWRLVPALFTILPPGASRKAERDLIEVLDPEGPLASRLATLPCPAELHGAIRMGLRSLRSHFQAGHRAREFLAAVGVAEASEEQPAVTSAEEEHRERVALLGEGLLVTRATAHRLERQAEQYKRDLQTTIPEAILRAREHGDLRENAEYKAAKEKQALTVQRLDELKQSLQSVRFIEDLPWEKGRVLPGTEVVLEGPDGEKRPLWLLGDGEDYLGEEVVSHRSPVGSSLLWKREGETVRLPARGGELEYRIATVRRRLPEGDGPA